MKIRLLGEGSLYDLHRQKAWLIEREKQRRRAAIYSFGIMVCIGIVLFIALTHK